MQRDSEVFATKLDEELARFRAAVLYAQESCTAVSTEESLSPPQSHVASALPWLDVSQQLSDSRAVGVGAEDGAPLDGHATSAGMGPHVPSATTPRFHFDGSRLDGHANGAGIADLSASQTTPMVITIVAVDAPQQKELWSTTDPAAESYVSRESRQTEAMLFSGGTEDAMKPEAPFVPWKRRREKTPNQYTAIERWAALVQTMLRGGGRVQVLECWQYDESLMSAPRLGLNGSVRSGDLLPWNTKPIMSSSSMSPYEPNPVLASWTDARDYKKISIRKRFASSSLSLRLSQEWWGTATAPSLLPRMAFRAVNPHSPFRVLWLFLGCAFLAEDFVDLTLSPFSAPTLPYAQEKDIANLAYWTLDIYLTFHTAVYLNGELVRAWSGIAREYLRTWFFFDLALTIISVLGLFLDPKRSGSLRILRFARYTRVIRVVRFGRFLNTFADLTNSVVSVTFLRACFYCLFVALWVHLSGCLWYLLGSSSPDGWANLEDVGEFPLNYMVTLQWTASQMQGSVDTPQATSVTERAFSVAHILLSVIILSLFVSKLTSTLHNLELYRNRIHQIERHASSYLEEFGISTDISVRVRRYIRWKERMECQNKYGLSEKELMSILPVDLRRQVLEQARSPWLGQNPVFVAIRVLSQPLYRCLCADVFEHIEHIPEEHVFWYGHVSKCMFWVTHGVGTYVKYGSMLCALLHFGRSKDSGSETADFVARHGRKNAAQVKRSTCLSEAALWIEWVHLGDCTATTQLSVMAMDNDKFRERVKSFPEVRMALGVHGREFASLLSEWDITDMSTSADLFEASMMGCEKSE